MYETFLLRCLLQFKIIALFISRHMTEIQQDFVQPSRILNRNINAVVIISLRDGFADRQ